MQHTSQRGRVSCSFIVFVDEADLSRKGTVLEHLETYRLHLKILHFKKRYNTSNRYNMDYFTPLPLEIYHRASRISV